MTLKIDSGYAPVDEHYDSVSLLLYGNGTNGSTTIVDSSPSPKTVTANNGAAISTAESKFGGSSIYFNGTTQSLSFADPVLGSGNFTIELWLKTNSSVQYAQIIGNEATSNGLGADGFTLLINHNSSTDGQIRLYIGTSPTSGGSTPVLNSTTGDWSDNAWHHIALTRLGNTFTLWTDGSANGTGTSTNDVNGSSTWYVGRNDAFTPRNLVGYIVDLRITKGIARYLTNFDPPTAPFPDLSPTGRIAL